MGKEVFSGSCEKWKQGANVWFHSADSDTTFMSGALDSRGLRESIKYFGKFQMSLKLKVDQKFIKRLNLGLKFV